MNLESVRWIFCIFFELMWIVGCYITINSAIKDPEEHGPKGAPDIDVRFINKEN